MLQTSHSFGTQSVTKTCPGREYIENLVADASGI